MPRNGDARKQIFLFLVLRATLLFIRYVSRGQTVVDAVAIAAERRVSNSTEQTKRRKFLNKARGTANFSRRLTWFYYFPYELFG